MCFQEKNVKFLPVLSILMSKNLFHITFALLLGFLFQACINEPDIEPNTHRGNFEALWKIIDTRYCYLDYKEIDWDAVYNKYSPRVDTVSDKYSLFNLLGEMLAELKDGHVNLYSEFDRSRYWNWYTDYPANFDSKLILNSRYLGDNYRIAGAFRYKKIADGTVGYVYYGSFSGKYNDANIFEIFSHFADCKGIIIDIRDNGGGMLTNSEVLASCFFTEKTLTGYITHKIGDGHSDFSKPKAVYTLSHEKLKWKRPVIVLTNRMTYSAANDFVCRMKYAPNAVIVGDKTGGGGGMPMSSELPNGWMVRFSASPMYDAEMQNTEWGLEPDVKVSMSELDKFLGYDTIIETAVKLLD